MAYINGKEVLFSPKIVMAEGSDIAVDQTFNPDSENAQSGKAVAQALSNVDRNKIFDYITYSIENNEALISSCDPAISGSHTIPNQINGYPVTRLLEKAFDGCGFLENITIPASIQSIDYAAFRDCNNLANIYYEGSEEQWSLIGIGDYNECLTNATIHCNQRPATVDYVNSQLGDIEALLGGI